MTRRSNVCFCLKAVAEGSVIAVDIIVAIAVSSSSSMHAKEPVNTWAT
jgi:hypothetical protein